jgi:uncharacterized protein (TIGR00251 family)
MEFLKKIEGGFDLRVKVTPKSARSEITGVGLDRVLIKLNAPPVDGAANKELIKLLSKKLGIAKSNISVLKGEKSRLKTIRALTVTRDRIEIVISESVISKNR